MSKKYEEGGLLDEISRGDKAASERNKRKPLYIIIILLGCMFLSSTAINIVMMNMNKKTLLKAGMAAQNAYNAIEEVKTIQRRSRMIDETTLVIKYYRPQMSEWLARKLATIIYDNGERKLGVPAEVSYITASLESKWKWNATNPKSRAAGIFQLMLPTAKWAASELRLTWDEDLRYSSINNTRMGVFVLSEYRRMFQYDFEWFLAGYGGEDSLDVLLSNFKAGKELPKRDQRYQNDWIKTRLKIERDILQHPLYIQGDERGNQSSSEMWEKIRSSFVTNR